MIRMHKPRGMLTVRVRAPTDACVTPVVSKSAAGDPGWIRGYVFYPSAALAPSSAVLFV